MFYNLTLFGQRQLHCQCCRSFLPRIFKRNVLYHIKHHQDKEIQYQLYYYCNTTAAKTCGTIVKHHWDKNCQSCIACVEKEEISYTLFRQKIQCHCCKYKTCVLKWVVSCIFMPNQLTVDNLFR